AKEAITPLTSIMRDKNGEVQKRAFQALLNVGSGDVPEFLDTMRKLNAEVHWAFPYILRQFGPKAKDAVKPLIKQLDSPDDGTRLHPYKRWSKKIRIRLSGMQRGLHCCVSCRTHRPTCAIK